MSSSVSSEFQATASTCETAWSIATGEAVTEPYAVYESAYAGHLPRPVSRGHLHRSRRGHALVAADARRYRQNGELIVPAGQYFVMGDNRNHSRDSRYWGFVPRAAIVGRPFIIYFSPRTRPRLPICRSCLASRLGSGDKLGHDKTRSTR